MIQILHRHFRSEKDGSAVTHRIPQQLEEKKMMMVFRQWCLGGGAPLNDPDPTLTFQIRERWLGRNTPDSTTVGREDSGLCSGTSLNDPDPTSVENILELSFSDESNDVSTKIGPTTHATAFKNTGLKGTRRKSCENYKRLN